MTGAIQITLGVIMACVTLMQISVLIAFRSGRFTGAAAATDAETERRIASIESRLERASESGSKLSSVVQTLVGRVDRLPEELRQIFVSRDTFDERVPPRRTGRDR